MTNVGLVYWCEGAGHAARNLAVASELEDRGIEVIMAGGGPGEKFVEINGFEGPGFETVTTFEKKTDPDVSKLEFLKEFVTDETLSYMKRFRQVYSWLEKEDPDKIITDDPTAVLAAAIQRREYYRIEHMTTEMHPRRVEYPLRIYDWLTRLSEGKILLTTAWDVEDPRKDVISVGPLAQKDDGDVEGFDVLLIPGTMSNGFGEIKDVLEDEGFEVRMVGDDDWEMVPSMRPFVEAADCVVCTGYSSIADTIVAGTPCVIYPFFSVQRRVAKEIEKDEPEGVATVESEEEAIEKAKRFCNQSVENPDFENGVRKIVDVVLE